MMIRTRTAILVAGAAAVLLTLSACSGGDYGSGVAPANQPQSAKQEVSQAGGVKLAVAQVGNLGQVVTDQNGLTLYRFDKDKAKPSVSTCKDACAETWPPALGDSANLQLQGVDAALVGAVTRADGTKQLTLNGWPLYTYAKDTAAGEAKGQGVGKTWFAVTPQGKKAQALAVSSGAPSSGAPSSGTPSSGAPSSGTPSSSAPGYGSGSGGY
jgi:predicted lipoprotein with Yx(FWY)xxD motif